MDAGAGGVAGNVPLFCQALNGNTSDKVIPFPHPWKCSPEHLRTEDETVIGLILDVAFIATFTNRFFTR